MAEVNGKMVTCDRCGKSIFLKCTGEKEMDGGFTRWNTFEKLPDTWGHHYEVGTLCPDCDAEYVAMVTEFNKKKREWKEEAAGKCI